MKTRFRSKKLVRNKVKTRLKFETVCFLTLFLACFRNKARKKARKDPQNGKLGPDHQNKAETRLKQGKNKVIFHMIFVAPVNKA